MKFLPLYRVTKDFCNPQYFFDRKLAEEFAEEMNATVDILYFYDEAKRLAVYNSMKPWRKE